MGFGSATVDLDLNDLLAEFLDDAASDRHGSWKLRIQRDAEAVWSPKDQNLVVKQPLPTVDIDQADPHHGRPKLLVDPLDRLALDQPTDDSHSQIIASGTRWTPLPVPACG